MCCTWANTAGSEPQQHLKPCKVFFCEQRVPSCLCLSPLDALMLSARKWPTWGQSFHLQRSQWWYLFPTHLCSFLPFLLLLLSVYCALLLCVSVNTANSLEESPTFTWGLQTSISLFFCFSPDTAAVSGETFPWTLWEELSHLNQPQHLWAL